MTNDISIVKINVSFFLQNSGQWRKQVMKNRKYGRICRPKTDTPNYWSVLSQIYIFFYLFLIHIRTYVRSRRGPGEKRGFEPLARHQNKIRKNFFSDFLSADFWQKLRE